MAARVDIFDWNGGGDIRILRLGQRGLQTRLSLETIQETTLLLKLFIVKSLVNLLANITQGPFTDSAQK